MIEKKYLLAIATSPHSNGNLKQWAKDGLAKSTKPQPKFCTEHHWLVKQATTNLIFIDCINCPLRIEIYKDDVAFKIYEPDFDVFCRVSLDKLNLDDKSIVFNSRQKFIDAAYDQCREDGVLRE